MTASRNGAKTAGGPGKRLGVQRSGLVARTAVLSVFALLFLALLSAQIAFAHAELVRSEPGANASLDAPPSELRLWFSEMPEPRFTEVQVLDAGGNLVQAVGPMERDPADASELRAPLVNLSPGVYTVAWRSTSALDGHVSSGSFAFSVGVSDPDGKGAATVSSGETGGTDPVEVAVRWLGYLGMSLLAGGLAFLLAVARPAAQRVARTAVRGGAYALEQDGDIDPSDGGLSAITLDEGILDGVALQRTLIVGWVLTFAATLLATLLQAARGTGLPVMAALSSPLWTVITSTRFGAITSARVLLLALLLTLIAGGRGLRPGSRSSVRTRAALGVSLLVLLTSALISHAAAQANPVPAVLADWLHIVAATFWVGGLVCLFETVRSGKRARTDKFNLLVAALVGRFSSFAAFSVLVLAVTGFVRAFGELSSWEDLLDTPYGNTLLIKLCLIMPLLGLAGVNRFFVQRRLPILGNPATSVGSGPSWHWTLRKTVGGELLLAVTVILVAGVLAATPPAVDAFGQGIVLRDQEDGLRGVLAVSSARPGFNVFDIYLRDDLLRPVTDVDKASLIFSSEMPGMGQTEAVSANLGGGHYRVEGEYLSMGGRWRIELLVRRPAAEDTRLRFALDVP